MPPATTPKPPRSGSIESHAWNRARCCVPAPLSRPYIEPSNLPSERASAANTSTLHRRPSRPAYRLDYLGDEQNIPAGRLSRPPTQTDPPRHYPKMLAPEPATA